MKFLIVFALVVVGALAAPQLATTPIPIINMELNNDNVGQYNLQFQTANGISTSSQGHLKDLGGKEGPVQVSQGAYSFIAPDGVTYTVQWTSDENGFHPQGAHLPTSPPIPEEIRQSIEANRREELARPAGAMDSDF